ncbi:hypothetical protein MOQ72_29305 [Saccharopolyspora sp. K220]|uniref:hypothetical protein n=1 Tax=Saccharopolyspora soli TaxID=2926618 RepID=UPI001F599549|nr:hypothetical protein [Saccharopolyspora soli]MCI2421540.1 hypothetical protein [Saccharopolyspora soli]
MPIPDPWAEQNQSADTTETAFNGAPERETERERPRERARVYPESTPDTGHGELVPFPGTAGEITPSDDAEGTPQWRAAVSVWIREAQESGRAAIDGSVWRARPPSLRDIHARVERAEWAGGLRWLVLPGMAFGYLSLLITALGYAVLWIARRPSRLAIATAITVVIVVLAI